MNSSIANSPVLRRLDPAVLTAFGVFVPTEAPGSSGAAAPGTPRMPVYSEAGGERLAANPLYD